MRGGCCIGLVVGTCLLSLIEAIRYDIAFAGDGFILAFEKNQDFSGHLGLELNQTVKVYVAHPNQSKLRKKEQRYDSIPNVNQ